jgi:rhodanese-related sulfurtransferase
MKMLLLFLLLLPLSSFSQQTGRIEILDPKAFEAKKIHLKATILDVRSNGAFETGFIQGAENVNWESKEFKENVKKLPHYQPVFIYCKSGDVSRKAANWMLEEGFTTMIILDNGLDAWKALGLKLVNQQGEVLNPRKSLDRSYEHQ